MKTIVTFALCAATLAGCGYTGGNNSAFLNNGNDVSFLQQGTGGECPGVADSNNPIYERYPLRCGPQTQVIPSQ